MKLKDTDLMIATVMIFTIIFISGCTEQVQKEAAISTPSSQAAPPSTSETTGVSGCTYLYDGTWKGIISDSGDLSVTRYDQDGVPVTTVNPFTAQYDFEMTIKCLSNYDGVESYDVTHVKASHPLFTCTDGCTPSYGGLNIGNDNKNLLIITFPNGAVIGFSDFQASHDGKTINLYITPESNELGGLDQTIGYDGTNNIYIETYNCKQYSGEGYCILTSLLKNTITLTKVS